jgi:hypothetical protein
VRRVLAQVAASTGSTGHGRLRARHCSAPEPSSISVAKPNTASLYSENHTSCGTADTSDDRAAPAPSATSRAGSAQQIRVLPLVSSASSEAVGAGSLICPPRP